MLRLVFVRMDHSDDEKKTEPNFGERTDRGKEQSYPDENTTSKEGQSVLQIEFVTHAHQHYGVFSEGLVAERYTAHGMLIVFPLFHPHLPG